MEIVQKQQIYELLLMPIVCDDRNRKNLERIDDVVYTGQKYASTYVDEDMSDYAVGFYEILYKNLLENQSMLNSKGNIIDWEFAGDTMNSFETVANKTPGAGKMRAERTPESEWPEFLRIYKRRYHSLANFWILPVETGRSLNGELNKARRAWDYMDRYLTVLREEVKFNGNERKYHNSFKGWDDFLDKHFLKKGYFDNDSIISISHGTAEEFTNAAIKAMEGRARDISESEYAQPLWEYFDRNGLVK